MKRTLAIIPARGGSKRIPRKNLKPFLGKPIISYSIQAALKANVFSEVMVSTDDKEIAELSESLGVSVPFMRSEETSNDFAGTAEVILEVLVNYQKLGKEFEYVCCIYPTALFIDSGILREGLEKMTSTQADSVFPVTKYSYPIQRSLKVSEDGLASMNWPENYSKRSQDLEPTYHDAGQFYFLNVESFLQHKKLFMIKNVPIIRDNKLVQDIDSFEDWELAEIKMKLFNKLETF